MKIEFQTTISKDKLGEFHSTITTYYDGIQVGLSVWLLPNITELHQVMTAYAQEQLAFFGLFNVSQIDKLKVK